MNSWCSNYSQYCNEIGPCSCGHFHTQPTNSNSNSFSMLFSSSSDGYNQGDLCHFTSPPSSSNSSSSSPSSSVDCTLSLGTPSTRLNNDNYERQSPSEYQRCPSSYNFSWDILQSKPSVHKTSRGTNGPAAAYNYDDPLLAKRCANCDTTSTPLWRNGPRGPKSLCNACGIRFKKEERRATAAAAATNGGAAEMMVGYPTYY